MATTITLPLAEAAEAVAAVTPHLSKDDVTPLITQAAIVTKDGTSHLVATDRYSVGTVKLTRSPDDTENDMLLTLPVLGWIAAIKPTTLRKATVLDTRYAVRLTVTPTTPATSGFSLVELLVVSDPAADLSEATEVERSQRFDPPYVPATGFPPVLRLFNLEPVTEASPVSLSLANLAKITAYMTKRNQREEGAKFTLLRSEQQGRPGPVLVEVGVLRALLQPNLLLR